MEDKQIIDLYLNRDESAVSATIEKYGDFCRYIASGILAEPEDIEVCLKEVYEGLQISIPTNRPGIWASTWEGLSAMLLSPIGNKVPQKRGGQPRSRRRWESLGNVFPMSAKVLRVLTGIFCSKH